MADRRRVVPIRRSRRLAGLNPSAEAAPRMGPQGPRSDTDAVVPDGRRASRNCRRPHVDVVQQVDTEPARMSVAVRPSPSRRFSDPTGGEGASVTLSIARHSSSSTTSPARNASRVTADLPSTSSAAVGAEPILADLAASSTEGSATGGHRSRGRRGVTGVHRRPGHGNLFHYTEQLGAVPVQGESFCRCPQQGQSRDLNCTCGEEDQGSTGRGVVTNVMLQCRTM
jgi:hypothetical protein